MKRHMARKLREVGVFQEPKDPAAKTAGADVPEPMTRADRRHAERILANYPPAERDAVRRAWGLPDSFGTAKRWGSK